ncbi:hypothetical protein VNI00_007400 [Paramarasmius palmivorus]|uniref:Uncharacterized protein n=1 Tax=Paramarasmius palmivorus TaxID=297713 RepID=A0AAW0D264_9AGAR
MSTESPSKSSVNVSSDGHDSKSKSGGLKPPKFLSRPKARSNTGAPIPDKKGAKDSRERSTSTPEPGLAFDLVRNGGTQGPQVREIVIPEEILNGPMGKTSQQNPALCEGW